MAPPLTLKHLLGVDYISKVLQKLLGINYPGTPLKQLTQKQLPWELEEEILSRLPLKAFLRCRTVCKRWNSFFNDKSFLRNLLPLPQFILVTASNIYSIGFDPNSIDPTIELCVLPSFDMPYDDRNLQYATITTCDEFLFCFNNLDWPTETAIWNPLLRQATWINKDYKFQVVGLGYDNSRPEKVYKMLVWYLGGYRDVQRKRDPYRIAVIYECASHAFKSIDTPDDDDWLTDQSGRSYVPLNGNLYWVKYNRKTCEYFIQSFDFSMENFKPLCLLPCPQNHGSDDNLLLAVFDGDRFSLLKIPDETGNIGVWVTKKRISYNNGADGEGVVWISLMTLSAINLPIMIIGNIVDDVINGETRYFIYNKTIFMCCGGSQTRAARIYVLKEDLCKEVPIGFEIVNFCHCVYLNRLQ